MNGNYGKSEIDRFKEYCAAIIASQNAATAKLTSLRIQKYLINRDDTMFIHTPEARIYVDTHCDDLGGLFFKMVTWPQGNSDSHETRTIDDVTELERTMKEISGDMRKWRVLKNGSGS